MAIKTPDILPGEPGYVSKKERTIKQKFKEKREKQKQKISLQIGKISLGSKAFRIGRQTVNPRKEKKFLVWRYMRKIGEIIILPDGEITLNFFRFGSVGNYKNLIQDVDFQRRWKEREKELLDNQKNCFLCNAKISKSAEPNLYHMKMWQRRAAIIEDAEKVPQEVTDGKITLEDGWKKFKDVLEEGNRYYMSLKDTALICSSCAKKKGLK